MNTRSSAASSTVTGMSGVIVAGMDALTVPPSTLYARTLRTEGASSGLRALMASIIDGWPTPRSTGFETYVLAVTAPRPYYGRIGVVDLGRRRLTCFVIDLFAREANDGRVGWDEWDDRGEPRLLDDVLDANGQVELYNCEIAVWPWRKTELYDGTYPPEH